METVLHITQPDKGLGCRHRFRVVQKLRRDLKFDFAKPFAGHEANPGRSLEQLVGTPSISYQPKVCPRTLPHKENANG